MQGQDQYGSLPLLIANCHRFTMRFIERLIAPELTFLWWRTLLQRAEIWPTRAIQFSLTTQEEKCWKSSSFQSSSMKCHTDWDAVCLSVCVNQLRQWRENQSKRFGLLGAQPPASCLWRRHAAKHMVPLVLCTVHRERGAVSKLWEIVCIANEAAARQTAKVSDHTLLRFVQTGEDKNASQEVLGLSPVGCFTRGDTKLALVVF